MNTSEYQGSLPPEVLAHYDTGYEAERLMAGTSQLEFARTQDILERYLPPPPAVVFDIGGGTGVYSCWLAKKGYEVHLIDAVPLHVEQAKRASARQSDHPIVRIELGDARKIRRDIESADVVLLLGPLYHLTERSDRLTALREAHRVLKPGGIIFGATISRFASILDGLTQGFLDDPGFVQIVDQDLRDGQHRNPTNHPLYFTTAFFHHPDELKNEIEEAGLRHEITLSVEGPGWLLGDFDERWRDEDRRKQLLHVLRRIEGESSMLGVSAHIMALARKGSPGL